MLTSVLPSSTTDQQLPGSATWPNTNDEQHPTGQPPPRTSSEQNMPIPYFGVSKPGAVMLRRLESLYMSYADEGCTAWRTNYQMLR